MVRVFFLFNLISAQSADLAGHHFSFDMISFMSTDTAIFFRASTGAGAKQNLEEGMEGGREGKKERERES